MPWVKESEESYRLDSEAARIKSSTSASGERAYIVERFSGDVVKGIYELKTHTLSLEPPESHKIFLNLEQRLNTRNDWEGLPDAFHIGTMGAFQTAALQSPKPES